MTNVKLKLMFFLLSALLTADIVQARPYSDNNTTDIVIKFTNNNTFHLPVDSNSDTLRVANEDQTPEETNLSSNTHMEDIMTAERDRDKDLSKKYMKEHINETPEGRDEGHNTHMEAIVTAERSRDEAFSKNVMREHKVIEISKGDVGEFERQLNASNSHLKDLMDAETDRDETLTDISEFAPRFEFLIAAKINESEVGSNKSVVKDSDNNLDKVDRNSSDVLRKVDYVELVEVLKPKTSENKSAYYANITGHEVDNDLAPDTRFTDVQTLFLACFGTLLPLLLVLFATLLIRCMCRRWCPGWCKKPTDSSLSDSSEKQDTNHQQMDVRNSRRSYYGSRGRQKTDPQGSRVWRTGTELQQTAPSSP